MIKLQRIEKPSYLTDKKVKELTDKFKSTGRSVWNHNQIKIPLSTSSYHKCAYCETDLADPATYMEVEHFIPKSKDPDLVVNWQNLLPSCKRCNGTKSDDDIIAKPIINPFDHEPKEELYFDVFCIFGKTELGINSVEILNLNDEKLFLKRCQVAGAARNELNKMYGEFSLSTKLNGHNRNRFRAVLLAAQPDRPYSAFVATIVHTTQQYEQIKSRLINDELWTRELTELHETSLNLVLPQS
ncbi:HNH endonuclease [Acinetobacter vivianii]|uniref:HNH endonuclease n=1 Tax=Acinetobacter vivianii TaxID=1776742 RepID=UPI002DB8CEDE|nr:HNH endonuclease [Acinetobacter vivianii]MEB6666346.1 HNH endonuclease [Acinetobacter vivianii]